jgi:hypothetical protein
MSADNPHFWHVATNRTLTFRLNVPTTVVCGERRIYQPGCLICGRAVLLETAKTDEIGMAIHDRCYFLKLKLRDASSYDAA